MLHNTVSKRGERGHHASSQTRRMKGVERAKAPQHQGRGKMGSVVRHVNEHAHKATTSAEGRAFSFGAWP